LTAGFRASPYAIDPFPSEYYWYDVGSQLSTKVENSDIGCIWTVGVAGDDGKCYLNFPSDGLTYSDISFSDEDANEVYLDYFDERGISVWISVEPGNADVLSLISLVLDRYSSHPCIAGICIDVEWYKWQTNENGKQISDDEAELWCDQIKSYNETYTLQLKHWLTEKMPSTYRDGLYFIDDGQQFVSLDHMLEYFTEWGEHFPDDPVGFQIGYPADKTWWEQYDDPYGVIANAIIAEIPNTRSVYWVDFSIADLFPFEEFGSTYYVAPDGSNSNPGTSELPWATPGYASRRLNPGDTLIIRDGTYIQSIYEEDIIIPPSGEENRWITIKGEENSCPVLKGRDNLYSSIEISGKSYLKIENLEITSDNCAPFRGGVEGSGEPLHHIILKDLFIHHIDEFGIDLRDVDYLTIENCTIDYCGFGAIGSPEGQYGGWKNVLVSNSDLSYSGHYYQGEAGPGPYERPDGFGIEASDGPIEIAFTTVVHNMGDGLDSKAENTNIHHCIVANNNCDGVKLWGSGSRIENTLIYGTGDGIGGSSPWAGIVIQTDDPGMSYFDIINVDIHDNPERLAYPMYVQYDSSNPITLTMKNCIVSNGYGVAYFGDSVQLVVENNIFFRPDQADQVYANGRMYATDDIMNGKLGIGNICANPLFIAPAWGSVGDYHLQSGSPAIDKGTSDGAPSTDLEGNERPTGEGVDIGSFEYQT
jgi:hypothetical protein